jgi:transcriptional regulator with XRE-family HTH domain
MTAPLNNVYAARRACGLSQEAFARLFGLSQTEINRWETGRRGVTRMTDLLMRLVLKDPERMTGLIAELTEVPKPVGRVAFKAEEITETIEAVMDPLPPQFPTVGLREVASEPTIMPMTLPEPEPTALGRTSISFAPNSWEEPAPDPDAPETPFVGDGPPPHARSGGAGAYDPDLGYMGGQEDVPID